MKNTLLILLTSILFVQGCAMTPRIYRPTGNASSADFEKIKYICETQAEQNHQLRMAGVRNNRPPPSYNTNINCMDMGYSVSCYGTSTPNNGLANLAEALAGLASLAKQTDDLDKCFAYHGFVPQESNSSGGGYEPSKNTGVEYDGKEIQQQMQEFLETKAIPYSNELIKVNVKLKLKIHNKNEFLLFDEYKTEHYDASFARTFYDKNHKSSIAFRGDPCSSDVKFVNYSKMEKKIKFLEKSNLIEGCVGLIVGNDDNQVFGTYYLIED